MENYWFCTDHNVRLEQHTNRYSGNPFFSLKKEKIDVGLNNAVAVKKIDVRSIDRGKALALEYFNQFPDEEVFECVGTICPSCRKVFVSPRHITTKDLGDLDFGSYSHWWIFRSPTAEKLDQNRRTGFFFFRYYLYAYLLNYTMLLEVKLFGRYFKIGLYVLFPITLLILALILAGTGGFGYFGNF
ncbi:MAG: hypothetical protein ACXAC7_16960 [Candidatus Hodarchaeales archaeon]|jgi:hypothetical protein